MKLLFCLFYLFVTVFSLETVDFTIALKQRNLFLLEHLANEVSDVNSEYYGMYINDLEFIRDLTSPHYIDSVRVVNWVNSYNVDVLDDWGDALHCIGFVEDVNRMFKVNLIKNNDIGKYLATTDYTIPEHLNDIIVFVEGISNNLKPGLRLKAPQVNSPVVDDSYSGKEVVYRLYNVTGLDNIGSNISVGSIEYQNYSGFNETDLLQSQQMNDVTEKNVTKIVGNDVEPDLESQLDMQMMAINVPNADIWFWDGTDWLYSLAVNMVNSQQIPDIVSMSWGWSESQQCTITSCDNETSRQYVNRVNTEYMKLVLRGLTITVSSGDSGAPGRTNLGCDDDSDTVHAVFPGSSPWVTSVGATYVVKSNLTQNWTTPLCKENSCAAGDMEYVANKRDTGWTAGGGINNYTVRTKTAKWQNNVVSNYLNSGVPLPINFNTGGRGYPDVSVVGHYCPVFDSGKIMAIDGTSCSSPIFASLVALLNDHQVKNGKSKLGFINPLLYQMAQDNPDIFNDIEDGNNWSTEGNICEERADGGSNFGYKATKGWDPVYGLGTPNIGLMVEWLDTHT